MLFSSWARSAASHPSFQAALQNIDGGWEWQSLSAEARPLLVAQQFLAHKRKILVVTGTHERALAWEAKLRICGIRESAITQLPSGSSALFEDAAPETSALSDRIGALKALIGAEPCIVIATAGAALERTLPRDVLIDAFTDLRTGATVDHDALSHQLKTMGYEKSEPVRLPGQFSQRGGILDIWASGSDLPTRIEFFDDQIESMRAFDPATQRSVQPIETLSIWPSRETLFTGDEANIRDLLLQTLEREAPLLDDEASHRLEEVIRGDAQALVRGVFFDRLDLYRPLLHPDSGCAIDLLGPTDLVVLEEPLELDKIAARAEEELGEALQARANRGEILHSVPNDYQLPPDHFASHETLISMSAMNVLPSWLTLNNSYDWDSVTLESYRGRPDAFTQTILNWINAGFTVVFASDQPTRAKAVLSQAEIFPAETLEASSDSPVILAQGNLGGGFVMTQARVAIVTDAELFGVARLRLPQKRFTDGVPIATVLDLKPGDFVVHINFGIGVFRGLTKRAVEGVEKEFLFIEYAAPDKLFVPADQLDRIQKYLNPGDAHPKLNRLTGGEWQKTIGKAREDARAFAGELVRLYAERKKVQRKPFGPDTPWQAEMEATFPWVETRSQMAAIKDAKNDLRLPFPMDRLVCGDVGFGKTEVAIRAAFKVAQSGRQVAILCPTTILSEQHFRNFAERLGPFPIRMALLNRFRSSSERSQILRQLSAGEIDLVIGTHSLLGKEIEFKDLGLVVIDEEQKFGVKQKEALKQLRTSVDVLTMSATPIPRTLSMALMDIRQMSLINDPPPGRLPIRTFLRPYSAEVIREAILRELARGGQVFYVYNRVESIFHVAEKLRKLVPMARIGVGHGQMSEKELEPVMIGFIKGEIDVLLSTTIVENGIDIPNANTLLVENADRLGLSQLYQLRGRVGRADRQAYAYLLYQSHKELSDNSMQRLQALQEFSTLGSGYSLAFRDLQIRGAGELLGAKQHGAMAAVGYELYTQLINECVASLKMAVDGHKADDQRDPLASLEPLPALDLPIPAFIPDTYIADQAQRLYFYQKLMSSRELSAIGEVRAEIEDRYGHAPEAVANAFAVMHLRILAKAFGVTKIDGNGGRLAIAFKDRQAVPPRVFSILGRMKRDAYVSRDALIWPYASDPIRACEHFLDSIKAATDEYIAAKEELGV